MKGHIRKLQRANVEKWIGRSMIVLCFILFLGTSIFSGAILAQEKYPTKPITYIIGYSAGGTSDVSSRSLIATTSKVLGQPIVAVNKPGGASAVAIAGLKNEKPDGYTLSVLSSGAAIAQHMRKLTYDTAKDFTPIMQYGAIEEGIVVSRDAPWKTFKEFIEYAKANPGKIRYSTPGPGSLAHLAMEQLGSQAKVKWTHIPFEGTAPSIAAILGGHVDACADNVLFKPHVIAGRLRLLVAFKDKRINFAPDVPTLKELGYDIFHPSFFGVIGPKGLSPQVLETLHGAFKKGLEDPDFIRTMEQLDMLIEYRSPQEFGKMLVKTNEEVGSLIGRLGLRKE